MAAEAGGNGWERDVRVTEQIDALSALGTNPIMPTSWLRGFCLRAIDTLCVILRGNFMGVICGRFLS